MGLKGNLVAVYCGKGDTSYRDLILEIDLQDDWSPPTTTRVTLTSKQIAKLEHEIKKWHRGQEKDNDE